MTAPMLIPQAGRTLFYPVDMGADPKKTPEGINANRPIIMFRCEGRVGDGGAQYIGFPIPQGIDFSDGASYDDATLGYSGAAALGAVSTITSGNMAENAKAFSGSGGIDQLKSQVKGNLPSAASLITAGISGFDSSIKSGVGIAMQMTTNKHIVTEFTGVGTRSFGFKFKLVGSSKRESEIIRDIGKAFRNGLYPEADILALKYPPKWTIRFMMGSSDIDYLPKIWECYLTSLNVSYNGSANLWHVDGAPIECDITVSFKETRSLRHQDIRALEDNEFLQIPKGSRDGYKIPESETLFSNTGNINVINPNAVQQSN